VRLKIGGVKYANCRHHTLLLLILSKFYNDMGDNINMYGVGIIGTGRYLPSKIIGNDQIEAQCGLKGGDILEKTGIKRRFVVEDHETASSMSATCALQALTASNINPSQIGLIICCTFTGDYVYPALACKVQELIGAKNAGSFDVMANCTSFQVGLTIASDRMKCDPTIRYALVIGVALQSRFINWSDPNTAIYFSDGAGAAVLGQVPPGYGILASEIFTNSSVFEAVRMRGGGSSYPMRDENVNNGLQFYEMNGLEVWKQVMQNQPKALTFRANAVFFRDFQPIEKQHVRINAMPAHFVDQADFHLGAIKLGVE